MDPAQMQAMADQLKQIEGAGYPAYRQNFAPSQVPTGAPGGGGMPGVQGPMQNPYGNVGITNSEAMMGNPQFQYGAPQMPGPPQEPGLLQAITGIMALIKARADEKAMAKGKSEAASGKHLKEAEDEEKKRRRQKQIEMDEAMGRNREKAEAESRPAKQEEFVPDAMNRMIDRIWEKLG
jgi:hypothetical protein